jgi:hypothetical protein
MGNQSGARICLDLAFAQRPFGNRVLGIYHIARMKYLRFYPLLLTLIITNLASLILTPIVRADIPIRRLSQQSTTDRHPQFLNRGTEILLNGKTLAIPWAQWQVGNSIRLGIGDTALDRQLGVELFSNSNYAKQPLDWYGLTRANAIVKLSSQYRYIDITDLAKNSGWKWQLTSTKLQLDTPAARVVNALRDTTPKNGKITVTLDRSTPWKLSQTPTEGYLTIEANADPALFSQLNAPPPIIDL